MTYVALPSYMNSIVGAIQPGHRLSLTTAVPITSSDVTGTTIYLTQFRGTALPLFDGLNWNVVNFTEISLALGTLTANLPYDVFCYNNAGTATLELLAWTNATTRATAIAYQNGVPSKTGALTRRLMGTIYTVSTTQVTDSVLVRGVSNLYNAVPRPLLVVDSTASWNYTTQTWRQARAQTANRFEYVACELGRALTAKLMCPYSGSNVTQAVGVGIGIDSTTAPSNLYGACSFGSYAPMGVALYSGFPGVGYHAINWLEVGGTSGVFYGAVNSTSPTGGAQAGMVGEILG